VFGILVDRLRPRRAGIIGQVIVILGLTCAWLVGVSSYLGTLGVGLILGVAGASFAVALPFWLRPKSVTAFFVFTMAPGEFTVNSG